jgi:hypothetical protein
MSSHRSMKPAPVFRPSATTLPMGSQYHCLQCVVIGRVQWGHDEGHVETFECTTTSKDVRNDTIGEGKKQGTMTKVAADAM